MSKRYYLETSIIRSYLIGHSLHKNLLREKLQSKIKITSKFVKMEYNRGLICNLINFYFTLSRSDSISDAIKLWSNRFRIREIKDVLVGAISEVFIGLTDDNIDLAMFKLRNQIKILLISFNFLIDRYDKNKSKCHLGDYEINFRSTNKASDIEKEFADFIKVYRNNHINSCTINNLLGDSKTFIEKLLDYSSNKKFTKQQDNIAEILKRKNMSCSGCKNIGDLIITLECPDYAILITMDEDFKILCEISELNYEIIPSVNKIISENSNNIKN